MGWWIAGIYALASLVTFIAYSIDKDRAHLGRWRLRESTLHLKELLGGWPGALIAQRVFRHKLRKTGYMIFVWLIVFGHVAFWMWWWTKLS